MAAMGDYLETALLNHIFRNTSFTAPTTVYVSLHTADPTDAGSGTEVSGNGYARVARSTGDAGTGTNSKWTTPNTHATDTAAKWVENVDAITFPTPTGTWGTVTHFAIWGASTGTTTLLFYGALTAAKTINSGDVVEFAAGDLEILLK